MKTTSKILKTKGNVTEILVSSEDEETGTRMAIKARVTVAGNKSDG